MIKPLCSVKNCGKEALIKVYGAWFCGECIAKWNEKLNEERQKEIEAAING